MAKLKRALENMRTASRVVFKTTHLTKRQNVGRRAAGGGIVLRRAAPALPGRGRRGKAGPIVGEGSLIDGLLHLRLHGGQDELLVRGRRSVAKRDGDWQPRHGYLAEGQVPLFVFDPERFFSVIANQKLPITRVSAGTFADRPVEVYTLSFDNKAARALVWAGAVCRVQRGRRRRLAGSPVDTCPHSARASKSGWTSRSSSNRGAGWFSTSR